MRGCATVAFLCLIALLFSPVSDVFSQKKIPPRLLGRFDIAKDQQNALVYGAASDETLTQFGALIAGDFNGDGIADVAAGAVNSNGPDGKRHLAGAVYVFFGGNWPKEIDLAKKKKQDKVQTPPADAVIYGAKPDQQLGYALAAGDLNGDKIDDLIVSAVNADGPNGTRIDTGEVYVIFGKFSGVLDLAGAKSGPGVQVIGARTGDFTGTALATGDVNSDGLDDLIIGAKFAEDGRGNAGAAYLLYGNKSWAKSIDLAQKPADLTVYGRNVESGLGSAVASADINGDRIEDVIIGAPLANGPDNLRTDAGDVYVFYGKLFENTAQARIVNLKNEKADLEIYGADFLDQLGAALGHCVRRETARRCSDVNKDNIDDLVIGAPGASGPNNKRPGATGEVIVLFGRKDFPAVLDLNKEQNKPNLIIYGPTLQSHLGVSVATGDINGDKFSDILVGAESAPGPKDDEGFLRNRVGQAYVVYGGKALPTLIDVAAKVGPAPDVTVSGAYYEDHFGNAVALGDTNNDGFSDLFIGAFDADGPALERTNAGELYLIYGLGPKPVLLRATKKSQVIGADELTQNGLLEYTITIKNESKGDQEDNEGNEMFDPLPLGMDVDSTSLKASSGKVAYDPETRYVTWNGAIPSQESVTVTFRVRVRIPPGDLLVRNQAKVRYDSQGIYLNDGVALTNITEDPVIESFDESIKVLDVLATPTPSQRPTLVSFFAEGEGISAILVKITDLSGRVLFTSPWGANGLSWSPQNQSQPSAHNGVYLYTVLARGANGKIVRTGLKKLVIKR
jgi:hypothetical protein